MTLLVKHFIYIVIIYCSLAFVVCYSYQKASSDDPYEKTNRIIFAFNDSLDKNLLNPISKFYKNFVPLQIRNILGNFFSNLGEIKNFINSLLQLKFKDAFTCISRFTINTCIGMLGFIDVASAYNIEKKGYDFGLTLAQWNVPSGPYIVLPFLGSSTLRSAVGKIPDCLFNLTNYISPSSNIIEVVEFRTSLLNKEALILGDKYSFIRDVYLQNRNYKIADEDITKDNF